MVGQPGGHIGLQAHNSAVADLGGRCADRDRASGEVYVAPFQAGQFLRTFPSIGFNFKTQVNAVATRKGTVHPHHG